MRTQELGVRGAARPATEAVRELRPGKHSRLLVSTTALPQTGFLCALGCKQAKGRDISRWRRVPWVSLCRAIYYQEVPTAQIQKGVFSFTKAAVAPPLPAVK